MRPPVGVECATCREDKQHRCQAQIYVDDRPLCLPCADGDPCVVDRVGAPRLDGPEMFEVETPPAPVIHRTPEELGLPHTVAEGRASRYLSDEEFALERRKAFELSAAVRRREHSPREPRGRGKRLTPAAVTDARQYLAAHRWRGAVNAMANKHGVNAKSISNIMTGKTHAGTVLRSDVAGLKKEKEIPPAVVNKNHPGEKRTEDGMDEMREAVKKLGGTMSDRELGEKLGVSGSRVGQLRKELGIRATKPGPRANRPQKSTALIRPGQRAVEIDSGPHPGVDALAGEGTVRVSIEMTRAQACERFGSLSPAQMGIALEAAMKAAARG